MSYPLDVVFLQAAKKKGRRRQGEEVHPEDGGYSHEVDLVTSIASTEILEARDKYPDAEILVTRDRVFHRKIRACSEVSKESGDPTQQGWFFYVLSVKRGVSPWRFPIQCRGATDVLELAPPLSEDDRTENIKDGDFLKIVPIAEEDEFQ